MKTYKSKDPSSKPLKDTLKVKKHLEMRRFCLQRDVDVSGVSGSGVVAEGVEFSNGSVALSWLSTYSSTVFYDNIKTLEHIHGHSGSTRIIWIDKGDCDVEI